MIENNSGIKIDNFSILNINTDIPDKFYESILKKPLDLIGRGIMAKLAPFEAWVIQTEYNASQKLKAISNLASEKISNINPDNLVTPEPYIAIPAIEAIDYSMDSEELRNMFASLLASSVNSDTKDNVHPAFVDIIKQLTPADAKSMIFFKKISSNTKLRLIPSFYIRLQSNSNNIIIKETDRNIYLQDQANTGFDLFPYIYYDDNLNTIDDIKKLSMSIDNLKRLGLIEVSNEYFLHGEFRYSTYEDLPIYDKIIDHCKLLIKENNLNKDIAFLRQSMTITDFGANFIKTCIL